MRILAIRGFNLASLAGPFELDLTAEPIAGTGLFAISGETGAGKSTILDALALALYGEHPRAGGSERQPDPASADGLGAGDSRALLRRGTGSGFAEADFVGIDGEAYRARWAVNRARGRAGGNLQAADRSLVRIADGSGRASGERQVTRAVEELTGLTFAQFRRTVLLAQGEFDAFLMANEANRAELLERITGTEIYRSISRRVHEMQGERQQKHRALVERREAIGLLDEAALARLSDERAHALELADAGATLLAIRSEWQGAESRHAAAATAIPGLVAAVAEAEAGAETIGPGAAEAAEVVRLLEPLWEEATRKDEAIRLEEKEALRLANAVSEAVRSERAAETGLAAAVENARQAQQRHDDLVRRVAEGERLDGLVLMQDDIRERFAKRKDFARQESEALDRRRLARVQIDGLTNRIEALEAEAVGLKRALADFDTVRETLERERGGIDAVALADERGRLTRQLPAAREAWRQAGNVQKAFEAGRKAQSDKAEAEASVIAHEAEAGKAAMEATAAEIAAQALDSPVDLADAATGREAARLRSLLVAGQPCPVCGGTDHPHAHGIDALAGIAARMRTERENHRSRAKRSRERERVQAGLAQVARGNAITADKAIRRAASEADEAGRAYAEEVAALAGHDVPPEPTPAARDQLMALGTELAARERAVGTELGRLDGIRKQLEDLAAKDREARGKLGACADKLGEARKAAAEAGLDLAKAEQELLGLVGPEGRLTSITHQIGRDLAPLGLDIATVDADPDAALRAMDRAIADRAALRAAEAAASRLVTEAGLSAERCRAALEGARVARESAEQTSADKVVAVEAARRERAALLDGEPTEEHRRRHREAAAEAGKAAEAARLALANAQAEERAATERVGLLRAALGEAESALSSAEQRFAHALAKRAAESAEGADEPPADLAGFIAARQQEAGAIAERLLMDDSARRSAASLAAEIAAAEADLAVWNDVHAAIGSASGDVFRRFAQGFTLDHLVALANEHLAALSPRYRLERGALSDLALVVIDRDMADERRAIRSLSGGERFLVSLGLALALSGLEGRQAFVDTLFIDEGFGALDAETLDLAVDALEALQGRGRKVGVVTHVAAMIERIAVKVLVEKRGGGRSEVRVVGGY